MKKVTIKITLSLLIVTLFVAILAGCSDSNTKDLTTRIAELAYSKLNEENSGAPKAILKEGTGSSKTKFDLREYPISADGSTTINVVGSVKNQGLWGTCWSFAAISACESSLMSQRKINRYSTENIDLSELHLSYFTYDVQKTNDDKQLGEGAYYENGEVPVEQRLNGGGYADYAASSLANGIGPVLEAEVPYKNSYGTKYTGKYGLFCYDTDPYDGWIVDQDLKYDTYAILASTNYLPSPAKADEAGIAAIKSELMKGHAVCIGYKADTSIPEETRDDTYISTHWAQYCDEPLESNHEVCIIGWDDDYPVSNFNAAHQPPANGAWIVKNSWGADVDTNGSAIEFPNQGNWGIGEKGKQTGYFYLSYYDQTIAEAETYEFAELGTIKSIHNSEKFEEFSYDYLPYEASGVKMITSDELNAQSIKQANVFTNNTGKTLTLKDVSYTTAAANSDVTWEIYVYDKTAYSAQEVLSTRTPNATRTVENITYRGFHRVSLNSAVEVQPGESVIIAVTEKSKGSYVLGFTIINGKDDHIEKDEDTGKETEQIYFIGVCNRGESLVCVDGQWADWSEVISKTKSLCEQEDWYAFDNLKIKGFATYTD